MAKGNRKRVLQYKNEYGLYFVFADVIFEQVSISKDMPINRVKDFSILFYIQKYIIRSNHIVLPDLLLAAEKLGLEYNLFTLRSIFRYFRDRELVDFYGSRYHLNDNAFNFIKSYGYWLNFYMNNFHNLRTGELPMLRNKVRERAKRWRRKQDKLKKDNENNEENS